jgi:preprotein translocase subunit YajC
MKRYSLLMIFLPTLAMAEAAPGGAQGVTPFLPLIVIFGIFYFLIIRPQQKRAKQQTQFLSELKRGDMVITQSGIVGMVKALSDKLVTLEVDEGVCLKVLRNQILEAANTLNKDPKPA